MTDSVIYSVVEAIIESLNEAPPTGVPQAGSRRYMEGEEVTAPRIGVFLGDESVGPARGHPANDPLTLRDAQIAVQCIGVADDIEKLDACVDPLVQHVVATLGRSRLGRRVHWLRETATTRRAFYQHRYVMVLTVLFEVRYQTLRDDLTRRS